MVSKLGELAVRRGSEIRTEAAFLKRPLIRFQNRPALDELERGFFRYPYRPYHGNDGSIRLIQAETPAAEVEFAVNGILQLVKKEGFRYREIALVCGDLPGYGKEISRQFEENGIPAFLDQKQEVSGNPLVRLVKCIPELLWKGFDHENHVPLSENRPGDGGQRAAGSSGIFMCVPWGSGDFQDGRRPGKEPLRAAPA